jgi:tetratricopeptide (TPR) repeat protein
MESRHPESTVTDSPCPQCDGTFTAELQRCSTCGFTRAGVRLYKPKHFIWWAMLFSGLTTIYMAATNMSRMGHRREKWLWLGLGFAGFVAVFAVLSFLPDVGAFGHLIGYGLNLPIGWYLRDQQQGLFKMGLSFGAKQASSLIGVVLGLGLTLLALATPTVPLTVWYEMRFASGVTALSEDRCEDARATFLDLLAFDSEDTLATYNLGVAELCLDHLEWAAKSFRDYATREPNDPDGHAMLAYCFWLNDRDDAARSRLKKALELDPGVIERLGIEEIADIQP